MSVTGTESVLTYQAAGQPYGARTWAGELWADEARLRRVLMIGGVSLILAASAIFYLTGGRYVAADDSYVEASKLMVLTDVSGLVKSVDVRESQHVMAGQVLFRLDPQPFQIALDNAKAALAQTVLDVASARADYRSVIGPILGPTLGGFLTDAYNWRWVFYINVPFGIALVAAIAIFFKDSKRDNTLKFDWFGFAALSVGLGALQLVLDRGTTKGWFSSSEVVVEAIVAVTGFYIFFVHMFTAAKSFIPLGMFKDRNLVGGLVLMFVLGSVLLASSALLSPYLQNLAGYSVTVTGILMVPRGLGTMFSMMFAGRLTMKMDPRILMTFGSALLAWSIWDMTGWTLDVSIATLSVVTFIQGIGMGFVFVPMNLVAFATLAPRYRTGGAALTNLMRNIGMAVGVSIKTTILASRVQTIHAHLSGFASLFNRALGVNGPSLMINHQIPFGLTNLDKLINYRAQVQAYTNDFIFMFYTSLPAFLIIWLMKRPSFVPEAAVKIEVTE